METLKVLVLYSCIFLHFWVFFNSFSYAVPRSQPVEDYYRCDRSTMPFGWKLQADCNLSEITYIIVISHRSLVHNVVLSNLEFFVSVCSIRFSIANTEFPRHFVPRKIFYFSSNIKIQVPCLDTIWIFHFHFWSKINGKIFHSVNDI